MIIFLSKIVGDVVESIEICDDMVVLCCFDGMNERVGQDDLVGFDVFVILGQLIDQL